MCQKRIEGSNPSVSAKCLKNKGKTAAAMRPFLFRRTLVWQKCCTAVGVAQVWHEGSMITTAIDALTLAVGALDGPSIRLVADRAEHLAQLLDDEAQAAEAYRAIAMLRSIGDAVEAEGSGDV